MTTTDAQANGEDCQCEETYDPVLKFRGRELIGFIWKVYATARICDAIKDLPFITEEEDPMDDQGAQNNLLQEWVDELQSLPVRDDGTSVFDKNPWIVKTQ